MTEKQKRALTLLRKSIPWVFLAVYGWCWSVSLRLTADVINGVYILPDDQIFSNAVLTCYMMDICLLGIILLAFVLVRKCLAPDTFQSYKIRKLQIEVNELHEKISRMELEYGRRGFGDQEENGDKETLVHMREDNEDSAVDSVDSGVCGDAVHDSPVCDRREDV